MVRLAVATLLLAIGAALPASADDAADCYANAGNVFPSEPTKVAAACRRLADNGDDRAQYTLARLYERGLGVPQSDVEAAKWDRMAAEQGKDTGQAALILGLDYSLGKGVPRDLVQSYMWISLAVARGHPLAPPALDAFSRQMTPAQIERAKALAAAWKPPPRPSPAAAPRSPAIVASAPPIVPPAPAGDAENCHSWVLDACRRLANNGEAWAERALGNMYERGDGITQDYAEAAKWYRKAANQSDPIAQTFLGAMYYKGNGVPQDYVEAIKFFRKAADQGHLDAQRILGRLYYDGVGVSQDYAEAAKWFREPAEHDIPFAQYYLGLMYDAGQGLPQDYVQAYLWYSLFNRGCCELHHPDDMNYKAKEYRDKIIAKMTPAQIEQAKALVAAWKPKTGQ